MVVVSDFSREAQEAAGRVQALFGGGDDAGSQLTVLLHDLKFFAGQLVWFEQNPIWNSNLADVVQGRRLEQQVDRHGIQLIGVG